MDHSLKVQENVLLRILSSERSPESRERIEVLLAEVRQRQIEAMMEARV